MFFKVLVSVVYLIIDKKMCLDYMFLKQEGLSLHDKSFHNHTFDDISGTGIPEVLMNIMSCYGYTK